MPSPSKPVEIDLRSIAEQRADAGLSSPSYEEKCLVWSRMSMPQAGVYEETGGYHPHRLIARAHASPARSILIAGGVRGGKSLGAAAEGVTWTPHSELIWLAAESYDLARQEFEYMEEGLLSLGWTEESLISLPKIRYQPCGMDTLWGCRVETRSLHDIATFAARAPDLIIICEPGQAPVETVPRARERLSSRRGRLWMAGTFEEVKEAWMEDLWRRWVHWPNSESGKSFSAPTWLNHYTYPGGKNDPELLLMRNSFESFNQFLLRCAGVPVPAASQVIGDSWRPHTHIVEGVEFEEVDRRGNRRPVELAVDPGFGGGSHYVVEAIQRDGKDKLIIDEVSVESMVHEAVIAECVSRPWWKNVVGGTMDPYAGSSHIFGATSPVDVWRQRAKIRLRLPPRVGVEESVGRLSASLRDPVTGVALLHVSPRCTRFIWEMTHWRRKRSASGGYGEPSRRNCDAAKAVAYYVTDEYNREQGGGEPVFVSQPYTWKP